MLNKVMLIGRLGRDPEVKFIASGQAVCNFTMATSEKWRDKNTNEMQEKTEWHRIVVWGKSGETVGQYAKKGSLIYIEGKLRYGSYTDKEGIKRNTLEIHADDFHFLTPKSETKPSGYSSESYEQSQSRIKRPEPEDIPF